jgi:nucleotide-binding universal stress UspA family protein
MIRRQKEPVMSNVIVCGTDRSAGASRAAAVASRLAEGLRRDLALVHIDREPPGMASIARARQFRELRRIAEAHAFPRHTNFRVAGGEPADELVRLASELDAELLVIGSGGRRELGSAFLGSVASELMRHAPCPLVIVPPDAALPSEPERPAIVCGVEGNGRDTDVLHLADDLRMRLHGTLKAVHAFDPSPVAAGAGGVTPPLMPELEETAHVRLSRALRESGVEAAAATVVSLPAAVALRRVADDDCASLIVLGCHGRGKVATVLLGSVAIQLAADASCPVVVLPPTAELAPGSGNYELASRVA